MRRRLVAGRISGQFGIGADLSKELIDVQNRVVPEHAVKHFERNAISGDNFLVHCAIVEMRVATVEYTQQPVVTPAALIDMLTAETVLAQHLERDVAALAVGGRNRVNQFFIRKLVAVDRKHPVITRKLHRRLLGGPETDERAVADRHVRERLRQRFAVIGAAVQIYNYLVQAHQRRQALLQCVRRVGTNDHGTNRYGRHAGFQSLVCAQYSAAPHIHGCPIRRSSGKIAAVINARRQRDARQVSGMSTLKSIGYVLNRFVLRRKFLLAKSGELSFRVKTEDVVGRHIYKYGEHEAEMSAFLRSTIKVQDGDLLVDIGANIGWYSMLYDRLCAGTDARVLSFEPDPANYAMLQHNIALNSADHVQAFQLGLSDNDEGAALHRFSDSNLGRHSLLPINDHDSVAVKTARLDDILAGDEFEGRTPRLIKIDIEGFELVALRGAPETLLRCPLVILEYSPAYMKRGGIEPAALLHYMRGLGFEAAVLRNGAPQPIAVDALAASERQQDIIWTRATH